MPARSAQRARTQQPSTSTKISALYPSLALACLTVGCQSDDNPKGANTSGASMTTDAGSSNTPVATVMIDRSGLTDVGSDAPLDYSDPRLWLCRPGNDPDECDANLDATELLADGSEKLVPHVKAKDPAFDCFYVYPTVKLTSAGPMTDFSNIDITLDPLLSQGAPFNELCSVYAPLYRQAGVVPGAGGAPMVSGMEDNTFALGLSDVRDAFKYYLDHFNKGRKFVLIGHSQGTGMLTTMMTTDVDPKPEVRAQMLSALLIGGGVGVPVGKTVGGTFQNIPLCTEPKQLSCVVAYNSFSKEVPPSPTSTFAGAPAAGQVDSCTEPATLAGRAGMPYQGSYIPLQSVNKSFAPQGIDKIPTDITTRFVLYRDAISGACKSDNGLGYLEISLVLPSDDPRPPPPYHSPGIEAALGLHLMDYNLELGDLLETVRLQAAAAAAK